MSSTALRQREPSESIVDGEFSFTRDDFQQIARQLYEHSGIALSESKVNLVYSRLAKRLRTLGIATFADYCALLASPAGVDERGAMLNALTTNVTRFFREPHHFDHLREEVLRPALSALRGGARMRLWSAGCSSGQEPYSIALTILSLLPEAPKLDIKILATDIDSKIVGQARAGAYSEDLVEPISSSLRDRWMQRDSQDGRMWRVGPEARSLVTFKELNLIGQWPVSGPFEAIFCRNVAIYFDEPTQDRVWSRFVPLLSPSGRLYIGHSERISPAVSGLRSDGLTIYRRTSGAV